jgi:hypothetical protein
MSDTNIMVTQNKSKVQENVAYMIVVEISAVHV